jgi:hypothetical protein
MYEDSVFGTINDDWVSPATAGLAALYELQVNLNSGTLSSGTVDSWLALTSTYTYEVNSGTAVIRVRIREAATGAIRTDQEVTMSVV